MKKIKEYFLYFIMYAIVGWIYEEVLEVVIYRWGFSNRGVLFGPWLPVYGFGALAFIFTMGRLLKNKNTKQKILLIPVIFLGCMAIATLIELFTSYLCEWTMGSWPWQTYASYKYNFQARIALSPSIRFGLGGLLFLYILQPIFERIVKKMGNKRRDIVFYVIGGLFLLDLIVKLLKLR